MIIAVDFDGTLALGNTFPVIAGKPNKLLINWLKYRKNHGDNILLWSCRENYGGINYKDHHYLDDAIEYCKQFGLFFDNVNANLHEKPNEYGTLYGRKITADLYIDDKSFPYSNMIFWLFFILFFEIKFR